MYYVERLRTNAARVGVEVPSGEFPYIELETLPEGILYFTNDGELRSKVYIEPDEPEEPIDPQDNPDIVKLQEQVEELEAAFDALTEGLV